ncbi:MAG: hypothetical protein EBX40_02875, partial [Gammaproteobacteria bacterium]|nr:hypothetical protein [Gammaproteobacteria bacterium]
GNICKNLELDKAASQKWQGLFERVNNKSKDIQLSLERIFLKLEQLNEMLNENVPAFNELLACIRASKNSSDPDCVKAHLKFVQAYQSNHALRSAAEFMMLEIMEGLNRNANDKVKPLLTFSQHDRNYFAHGDALRDSLRFNPIAHSANTLINLFTQDQYLIFALQILRRVERLADGEARKVSIENLIVQEAPNIKSLEENLTKIIPGSGDAFFEKCIQEICKPEQVHRLKDLFLAQRKKPKKEKKKGDFADGSLDWSAYDIQFAWQTLENQTAIGNFEYLLQERDIALLARTLYQYDHVGDGLVDFVVIGSSAQLKHAIRAHQGRLFSHPNQALTMVINLGNAHWVTMVVRHNSDSSNSLSPHMVLYRDSFGNPMPEAIRNNLNAFYPSAELQVIPGVQQTNFHACGILALENARLLTEETAAVLAGAHAAHFNTVVSEDALNARRIEWAEKLVQNPAEVDLDARGVAEVFFSAMTAGAPVQQASNQSAVVPQ